MPPLSDVTLVSSSATESPPKKSCLSNIQLTCVDMLMGSSGAADGQIPTEARRQGANEHI